MTHIEDLKIIYNEIKKYTETNDDFCFIALNIIMSKENIERLNLYLALQNIKETSMKIYDIYNLYPNNTSKIDNILKIVEISNCRDLDSYIHNKTSILKQVYTLMDFIFDNDLIDGYKDVEFTTRRNVYPTDFICKLENSKLKLRHYLEIKDEADYFSNFSSYKMYKITISL